MPHTAWAWRVLTGTTLADKLAPPAVDPGPVPAGHIPDVPGRPVGLALPNPGQAARSPFPAEHTLHEPEARGRALHFFANHELLALELLALALVRFPEAPAAFRRGLVGIAADEQRHLSSYLARMDAVGVRFGDLPVNRYFWDALAGASPLQLVAGLSLTFEQANLDFAAHYAAAFRRVGDLDTARVLDDVLADEIRHVAHGLAWFDTWRDPALSRWDAWVAALPPPLTPARGKGIRFHRAPREAAGLDADTITRLEAHGASKGRVPRVFSFHPEVESEIAGLPPSTSGARVTRDLASLLVFLAGKDDVVLLPRAPTPAHLAELARAGYAPPEIVEGPPAALAGRPLGALHPWGWSPAVADALAPLGASRGPGGWSPDLRPLYEKSWSVARLAERPDLCDPAVVGVVCRTFEEVERVATPAHVLKAPLGTAGRGNRRWGEPGVDLWARDVLAAQGALVVEPWLDRVLDLSLQFEVAADGRVSADAWGRFLTDGRGSYRGAVLGDVLRDQPPPVKRLLAEEGDRLYQVARHLGPAMAARGFTGPAGIDALVYRTPRGADGDGVALKPLVELNPRMTMGRVARAIGRRVRRDRVGLWTQVSRKDVRGAGFAGLAAWAAWLRERAPLVVSGDAALIDNGALFTTDPTRAERIVTVLVVGGALDECRERLGLGPPAGPPVGIVPPG
ncbi:MAG: DUF455 family protein [Pseudomonadota bacterium]|nr:DUF455 family protein [Pseudomonadota bacterium]